jgi:hypothetical protein
MNKISLVLLISILSININAQPATSIIGKWKIVSVNNGVDYNYKTDSSFVTKKLLDSLIGRKDSATSIEMLSIFTRQYTDYYFTFDDKLNYQEIRSGTVRVLGTYKVNTSIHSVEVLYGSGEIKKPHNFKYGFDKNNLKLYMASSFGDEFELTLERTQ